MKWTTANVKHANYAENHEIYVGTHTGSFKKIVTAYEQNPFAQHNLVDLSQLQKDSRICSLAFGNAEKSQILIGRAHNNVQLHSLKTEQLTQQWQVKTAPVVGLARYEQYLLAAFANGQIQRLSIVADADEVEPELLLKAGDDITHMRQCLQQRNLVATGGKGRQNNLKVFDMAADGKLVFSSKNLPNDFLQLEVPVWDSDVSFLNDAHTLATCSRYGYVRVYDTRKQRRPVQCFASAQQMSFAAMTAKDNYVYAGSSMGELKAFDVRNLKHFVHTYKGFTGGISDLCLDDSGKYLASACLDRYVRVHHTDNCALQYQCYVKSKAMRILLRESMENPNAQNETEQDDVLVTINKRGKKRAETAAAAENDEEYDDIFDKMPTICENEATEQAQYNDEDDDDEEQHEDEDDNDDDEQDEDDDDEQDEDEAENVSENDDEQDSENDADQTVETANSDSLLKTVKRKSNTQAELKTKKKKSQ